MRYLSTIILSILSLTTLAQGGKLDSFEISKQVAFQGSDPRNAYNFNETLICTPTDSGINRHVRQTNGTYAPSIVSLPQDVTNPIVYCFGSSYAQIGDTLYFGAYDSTKSGRVLCSFQQGKPLKKFEFITPTNDTPAFTHIDHLTSIGSYLIFSGTTANTQALCVTDLSTGKTRYIDTIKISPTNSIIAYNNKLYFPSQVDWNIGIELYEYDPYNDKLTVYDLNPGKDDSKPNHFKIYNNELYFFANKNKLFRFNSNSMTAPTAYNTIPNNNSTTVTISSSLSKSGTPVCIWNKALYFAASVDNNRTFLYKHDMQTNTTSVADTTLYDIRQLAVYNNKLFISGTDKTYGTELFIYDGTNKPSLVSDIYPGIDSSAPRELIVVNDRLFFSAISKTIGIELFMYDELTTAVKNTTFDATVTVYPNPAQDVAHIKMDLQATQKLSITLMDMQGRVVYNTGMAIYNSGSNIISIPTEKLSAGMYIYHISNDAGSTMMSGKLQKH